MEQYGGCDDLVEEVDIISTDALFNPYFRPDHRVASEHVRTR
jgi:hypothetical protein